MSKLLICNHYHTDLELSLTKPGPVGRRPITLGFRVPMGHAIDACGILNLPVIEAKPIVESSKEFQVFNSRKWLELIELFNENSESIFNTSINENDVRNISASKVEEIPEEHISYGGEPTSVEACINERETIARKEKELANENSAQENSYVAATSIIDESDSASESSLTEVESSTTSLDLMPSTRWSKDQLVEHALSKGLTGVESMSKNAILRKLRGL